MLTIAGVGSVVKSATQVLLSRDRHSGYSIRMPRKIYETPPRGRWFRFSLRTLFVMMVLTSIPLAWVSYSLNWIRERREFLSHTGVVGLVDGPAVLYISPTMSHALARQSVPASVPVFERSAPAGLWLFGEVGICELSCDVAAFPQAAEKAKVLFPEANIWVWRHYKTPDLGD